MLGKKNRLLDADRSGQLPACDSCSRFISSISEESFSENSGVHLANIAGDSNWTIVVKVQKAAFLVN